MLPFKKLIKFKKFLVLPITLLIITSAFLIINKLNTKFIFETDAVSVTDNDTGTWYTNFKSNNLGFMTPGPYNNGIVTKTAAGTASLASPGVEGYFYTTKITPASFKKWGKVTIDGTWGNPDDLKIGVYDCTNGNPTADASNDFTNAISGLGQGSGINYPTGGLDISTLPSTVRCLQVKIYLGINAAPPVLNKVSVSWDPLPVLLVAHSADATKTVGQNVCFQTKVSLSYASDKNLVLVVPLPNNVTSPGTVLYPNSYPTTGAALNSSSAYGQNANRSCDDIAIIDSGGYCTNVPIAGTGNNGIPLGFTVPAFSVYYPISNPTPPVTASGSTLVYNFCVKTPVGWQNNITYITRAYAKSDRSNLTNSDRIFSTPEIDPVYSVLKSTATIGIDKTSGGTINGHVNNDGGSATYTNVISYSIKYTATGTESLFNPTYTDDMSDIFTKLASAQCGNVADPASRVLSISNGGTITGNKITWNLGILPAGSSKVVTYRVNFAGCEDDLKLTNNAEFKSDNVGLTKDTESVIMGVDLNPTSGSGGGGGGGAGAISSSIWFAKGDQINGSTQVRPNADDNLGNDLVYGQSYSYILATNIGSSPVSYGNIVMIDKIPTTSTPAGSSTPDGVTFVSATIPPNVNGTIYYYTANSANASNNPPDYNSGTGAFDTSAGKWTTTLPSDPTTVKWVAVQIECLASTIFPPTSGVCYDTLNNRPRPNNTYMTVKVKLNAVSATSCQKYTIPNVGNFYAYNKAQTIDQNFTAIGDMPVMSTPSKYTDPYEPVTVTSTLASYANNAFNIGTSQSDIRPLDNVQFIWNARNNGDDASLNSHVFVDIPTVNIDGIAKYLEVVNTTQNGCTLMDPSLQTTTHKIEWDCKTIAQGGTRSGSVTFKIPKGIDDTGSLTVNAKITAEDDNKCAPISYAASGSTNLYAGKPILTQFKKRNLAIIPSGDDITYQIQYSNVGDGASTNTYMVDRLPEQTILKEVYTSGSVGTYSFNCPNCIVYYTSQVPPMLPNSTSTQPVDKDIFLANFTPFDPSWQVSPGKWVPPQSVIDKALYIGFKIDIKTGNLSKFGPGKSGAVGFKLTNDDDNIGPSTDGSPAGTIIKNYPAIFSDQNLQAISNEVWTTILPDPGITMSKRSNPENVVGANEPFDWIIDYKSNSGNPTVNFTVYDTLPVGIEYISATHTWNSTPASLGALAGTTQTLSPSIVNNPDGTTTIGVEVTGLLRGGNILKDEGGSIKIKVKASPSVTSNTRLVNTAKSVYDSGFGELEDEDTDDILIKNADVTINKLVDLLDPVVGDTVNYTLKISNRGEHDANGVKIVDTLPAGLCYVNNSSQALSSGWTISQPTVNPSSCDPTKPTTITWDNTLQGPSPLGIGVLPGIDINSGDYTEVYLRYSVTVSSSVSPGSSLQNAAQISTTTTEDPVFSNTSAQTLITPKPDLSVSKDAVATLLPGDLFDYTIKYRNLTRQSANNVYLIDTLPITPQLKIISVIPENQETICYSTQSTSPSFVSGGGCGQAGWSSTLSANSKFIAIDYSKGTRLFPGLGGPFNVTITAQAVNPANNSNLPVGSSFTNVVDVHTTDVENDVTNNSANVVSKIPGVDLAIVKTGSTEGAYPGLAPGDSLTYYFDILNTGTVDACGVTMIDTYPVGLTLATNPTTSLSLKLVDTLSGSAVLPRDPNGVQLTGDIPITFDLAQMKFTFGDDNVCFPPLTKTTVDLISSVNPDVDDKTIIYNSVTVSVPTFEEVKSNNSDDTQVTIYKADVTTRKDGISCGRDNICGNSDDSQTDVNPGESIRYKINYDNLGNIDAKDTIITENIPQGTCFTIGSITIPSGASLEYSIDGGGSWTYSPTATSGQDCSITNFRLIWTSMPSPANASIEDLTKDFTGTVYPSSTVNKANDELKLTSSPLAAFNTLSNANSNTIIGDVNGDQKNDFIVNNINGDEQLCLTQGTSPYYYCLALPSTSGLSITSLNLSDVNGDSINDFVIGNDAGQDEIVCASQSASPYYSCQAISGTGGNTKAFLDISDINSDGVTDFVILNSGQNKLTCLSQTSVPYYTCNAINSTSTNTVDGSVLNDVNGDNKKDLLLVNANGQDEQVCTSQSTSPFFSCVNITGTAGNSKSSVNIGDVNADSKTDYVIANSNSLSQVCTSDSVSPYFQCTGITGTGNDTSFITTLKDMGGTTALDLFISNDSLQDEQVCTSQAASPYYTCTTIANTAGNTRKALVTADLNTDSKDDLILANYGDDEKICQSQVATPYFTCSSLSTNGNTVNMTNLNDINGDSKSDFAIVNSDINELVCTSTSTNPFFSCAVLQNQTTLLNGGKSTSSLAISDINNDGKTDFIIGNQGQNKQVCTSTSTAPYENCVEIPNTASFTNAIKSLGDINADGKIDVFLSNGNNENEQTCVSQATSPYFSCVSVPNTGFNTRGAVDIGDRNADGKMDLLLVNNSGQTEVVCYSSGTSPYFTCDQTMATVGSTFGALNVGDKNSDNFNDFVLLNLDSNSMMCVTQVAAPYFSCTAITGTTNSIDAVLVGDVNGDTIQDFMLANDSGIDEQICTSQATTPYFSCAAITGTAGSTKSITQLSDLNNDGKNDYILANYGGDKKVCLTTGASPYFNCVGIASTSWNTNNISVLSDLNGDSVNELFVVNDSSQDEAICTSLSTSPYYSCSQIANSGGSSKSAQIITNTAIPSQKDVVVLNFDGDEKYCKAQNSYPYIQCHAGLEAFVSTGSYYTSLSSRAGISSWDKFIAVNSLPSGTSINYTLCKVAMSSGGTCSAANTIYNGTLTDGYVNISSLPIAQTTIYAKIDLKADPSNSLTPSVTRLLATWKGTSPSFNFDVKVMDNDVTNMPIDVNTIDNAVNIKTSTPELSKTNNNSSDTINLVQTDLKIEKVVDKSSAVPGDTLTYTLNYTNKGPNPAVDTIIKDIFPTNELNFITAISNTSGVNCNLVVDTITCTKTNWTLAVSEVGKITITGTIKAGVTNGTTIANTVNISSYTKDKDISNNDDTVFTHVGINPNVYVLKDGPAGVGIGENVTYYLTYGNNGNDVANDVKIEDMLDINLTFVSASIDNDYVISPVRSQTVAFTCTHSGLIPGGSVTCSANSPLPIGERGVIKIVANVKKDYSLLTNSTTIPNSATISTSSTEVDISDNNDSHDVLIVPGALSSISGKVFVDGNSDGTINNSTNILGQTVDDKIVEGAKVFLTGVDIKGNIILPDPNTYLTEFNSAISWLIAQNLIPLDIYDVNHIPSGATFKDPISTADDGTYNFSGLWPGDYSVISQTPTGYKSVSSSTAETTNLDPINDNGEGSIQKNSIPVTQIQGIHLDQNETSTMNNFGLLKGQIGNQIFKDIGSGSDYYNGVFNYTDTNNNGRYDSGDTALTSSQDQPISGVEVTLYIDSNRNGIVDSTDSVVGKTSTDTYGLYLFKDLDLNDATHTSIDYLVKVTERSDTTSNTPNVLSSLSNTALIAGSSENTSKNDNGYLITLSDSSTSNFTGDFGYLPKVEIGNQIWNDVDNDSIIDSTEVAIAGVKVDLFYDANGNGTLDSSEQYPISSTTTDVNGFYLFKENTLDSLGVPIVTPAPLKPGKYFVGIDKTNFGTGKILDRYFSSGTNLVITGTPTENVPDLTNTDNNDNGEKLSSGFYSGGVMSRVIDIVDGLAPTSEKATINQGTTALGLTPNLSPSDSIDKNSNLTVDFGFFKPPLASIGNLVWNDFDADGIQDNTESGISGITVKLFNAVGTEVASMLTDTNGNYLFSNLLPGNYHVEFSNIPNGYVVSDSRVGTDINVDSDGLITPITNLVGNENDMSWDLGIHQLASIGDKVWNDKNRDGIQDTGELGVANITVKLYNSNNNVVGTTTTNSSGNYSFANLQPGDYHVEFSNLPSDFLVSPTNTGTDILLDSDGLITPTTHLDSGENDFSWDLGIYQTASIGDKVWYDLNNDGIQNTTETPVPNVTVKLYKSDGTLVSTKTTDSQGKYLFDKLIPGDYYLVFENLPVNYYPTPNDKGTDDLKDSDVTTIANVYKTPTTTLVEGEVDLSWDMGIYQPAKLGDLVWNDVNNNGKLDAGEVGVPNVTVKLFDINGVEVQSTTTDTNGKYQFDNIFPGDYYVTYSNLPAGYAASPADKGGDDSKDSDATLINNVLKTPIYNLSQGEFDNSVDLGIFLGAAIGNKVFNDMNINGIQDSGDLPVSGVTVKLYDSTNTLVSSQVTDTNGEYHFINLVPGDYHVEFVNLPSGYKSTSANIGSDDVIDSDATLIAGSLVTPNTTLIAGEDDLSWDLGIYLPASLGDKVWSDINHDGLQDPSELGVQNVTVKLYDDQNNLISTKLTDTNGNYLFDDLKPGNYHVEFSNLPTGFVASPTNTGSDKDRDSDGLVTQSVTLMPGTNNMSLDLGIYQPAKVGNFVWEDTNGNGIQDSGELGVANVTVKLFNQFNQLVATTTTDTAGAYQFSNLGADTYHIEFSNLPQNFVETKVNATVMHRLILMVW